jgi:TonB family protein
MLAREGTREVTADCVPLQPPLQQGRTFHPTDTCWPRINASSPARGTRAGDYLAVSREFLRLIRGGQEPGDPPAAKMTPRRRNSASWPTTRTKSPRYRLCESGGGVGTGSGTGIGSGRGPGLGAGSGGGTGGGIYRPGGAVSAPRLIKEVKPKYTPEALRDRIQGTVVLEAVVSGDGCATRIQVVRSLDVGGLDEEAVAAVAQWRFEPGRLAGAPVDVLVVIMLDFSVR